MLQLQQPPTGNLATRRALECLGMCLIGDGLLSVAAPQRHVGLWRTNVEPWRSLIEPFAEHPQFTRMMGALELCTGFWLASRQYS
jgi:hypothetical protein